MGPATFPAGVGIEVRPHPHIGLATVTYLFAGTIIHRDTLGSHQTIIPGDVNWMTAGRGIAHSERTSAQDKLTLHDAHGLQSWVALPKAYEETAPEFFHHAGNSLPEFKLKDTFFKLIAGTSFGYTSPVKTYSPLFYLEAKMSAGGELELPKEYKERALYLMEGRLRIGPTTIDPRTMPVFASDETITIKAETPSHFVLLGGEPFPEQRFIWWNFVSTSEDRIAEAKMDWKAGRFGTIPGDERECIPLPE
jgi:redox-sensitive bicupin YhaK (pirin superfamily)